MDPLTEKMEVHRPRPKFGWTPEVEEAPSESLELVDISADTAPADDHTLLESLKITADETEKITEAYERLEQAVEAFMDEQLRLEMELLKMYEQYTGPYFEPEPELWIPGQVITTDNTDGLINPNQWNGVPWNGVPHDHSYGQGVQLGGFMDSSHILTAGETPGHDHSMGMSSVTSYECTSSNEQMVSDILSGTHTPMRAQAQASLDFAHPSVS